MLPETAHPAQHNADAWLPRTGAHTWQNRTWVLLQWITDASSCSAKHKVRQTLPIAECWGSQWIHRSSARARKLPTCPMSGKVSWFHPQASYFRCCFRRICVGCSCWQCCYLWWRTIWGVRAGKDVLQHNTQSSQLIDDCSMQQGASWWWCFLFQMQQQNLHLLRKKLRCPWFHNEINLAKVGMGDKP